MPDLYAAIEVEVAGVRFGTAAAGAVFVPEPVARAKPWLRISQPNPIEGDLPPDARTLCAAWADLLWAAQDFVSHGQGQHSMLRNEPGEPGGARYFVMAHADELQEVAPAGGKELEAAWRDMLPSDVAGPTLLEFTRAARPLDATLSSMAALLECVSVNQEPDLDADIGSRRIAVALAKRADQWSARLKRASTEWPDSGVVGKALGSRTLAAGRQRAARLRERGALLGVWVPSARAFHHPTFQFLDSDSGQCHHRLPSLLANLPAPDDDAWGWNRLTWLTTPRDELSERGLATATGAADALALPGEPRSPADVFPMNPEAVITLAKVDAEMAPDHDDTNENSRSQPRSRYKTSFQ